MDRVRKLNLWIGGDAGVDGGGWGVCSTDWSRRECTIVDGDRSFDWLCWRLVSFQYLPLSTATTPQGGGTPSSTSTSTNDDDRSAASSDAHALTSPGECDGVVVTSPFVPSWVARPPMPGRALLEARVAGLPEEDEESRRRRRGKG